MADELQSSGIEVDVTSSIEEAVTSADIVCAATHADRPVVRRQWLQPGTHLNSVGYNSSGEGEIDLATASAALVVVESRAVAFADPPAGAVELRKARDAGVINVNHVPEVGELLTGAATGRVDDSSMTFYKSVGVAVQDSAAASLIISAAMAKGAGISIDL